MGWQNQHDVSIFGLRIPVCRRFVRTLRALGCVGLLAGTVLTVQAALQFDVFIGYGGQPTGTDGVVREASWFPVACEVLNDGPSFNAVFELSTSQMGGSQTRRIVVELPTNTRKRFVIPAFAASGTYSSWDVRLLDERGKVRGEKTGLRPRGLNWESVLFGAVPRTFAGLPRLPELRGHNARSTMQPLVTRLQLEQFPDSPVPLEGLDAIYLNSEKALELKVNQAEALLSWVHGGGHLIVGVEQPSDVNATPWLRSLLPCELNNLVTVKSDRTIQEWLRRDSDDASGTKSNPKASAKLKPTQIPGYRPSSVASPFVALQPDTEFEQIEFSAAVGTVRDGQVLVSLGQTPLVIVGRRGRGEVTVLTFSPEREPFRSWKHRDWFWAKLVRVPSLWYSQDNLNFYGGRSVDSVVGAMIDSRQVRKLPVKWLMLLLVVYLIVIGPVDQYWLKRLGKQMLTWLTFPAYVVLFSLLIYYIGYKLRAGETEWNELHLVDVLPRGEAAMWRGRTYASVYSPVNARYQLASEQPDATLRGEFMGGAYGGGSQEGSRAEVEQRGNGFNAQIYVPVWTSQLFVSDWMQPDEMPFTATVVPQGNGLQVTVENRLARDLKELRLIARDRLYELGNLAANKTTTLTIGPERGRSLRDFVQQHAGQFQSAADQRQRAFGENTSRWIELNAANLTAATFISQSPYVGPAQRGFVYPDGVELTPLVERGDAVFLAWDAGNAPEGNSMRRFKTVRSQKNTMLRLAVPIGQPARL